MSDVVLPDVCKVGAFDRLFGPSLEGDLLRQAVAEVIAIAEENVELCRDVFEVHLDFSEGSVAVLDKLVTEDWDRPPEKLEFVVTEFGAYLAEVFHLNLGGQYSPRRNLLHLSIKYSMKDVEVFPFHKVHKRFTQGEPDSLAFFYKALKSELGQAKGRRSGSRRL